MNFIIDESNDNLIKDTLRAEIRDYNRPHLGSYHRQPFSIRKNNRDNALIAGVHGFIIKEHQTMRLEFVWVSEVHRKQGLGTALFHALEEFALQKSCKCIQASTMAFQSPGFYQKMGYQQVGCAPDWFCGQDELFFVKKLMLNDGQHPHHPKTSR